MCALALLGSGAHSGLLFYLVDHELGKHVWDIQAIKLTPDLAHLFNALGFTYVLVIFLVKVIRTASLLQPLRRQQDDALFDLLGSRVSRPLRASLSPVTISRHGGRLVIAQLR
ncbi:hypothetical protein XPA_008059 [Xanthoria parietina]